MSLHIALNNILTQSQLSAKVSSQTESRPLFVYGSLMLPSLFANVSGTSDDEKTVAFRMTPATLPDHICLSVRFADFPAVVPCASAVTKTHVRTPSNSVKGLLVFGLTDRERLWLDGYEGGLYNKMEVEVEVDVLNDEGESLAEQAAQKREKRMMDAEVYIWAGKRDELCEVDEKEWSFEEFLRSDMAHRWKGC